MNPLQARSIARQAHLGQLYGTLDYFEGHILPVVRRVGEDPLVTDDALVVGYLHDVVEDTYLELEDLVREGLSMSQYLALWAITRYDDEDYGPYIARVVTNDLALLVKHHDLQANLAANPTAAQAARYCAALKVTTEKLRRAYDASQAPI